MILIPLLQMKLPHYLAEKWELDIEEIDEKEITMQVSKQASCFKRGWRQKCS